MRHRRRAPALAAAAGMICAGAIQLAIGLAGLDLLLRTDRLALAMLRWGGAAVLLTWGVLSLRSALRARRPTEEQSAAAGATRNNYLQGLLCTGSNPKVGLFLMVFLPQFVPKASDPLPGMLVLGAAYLGMGFSWLVIYISLLYQLERRTAFSPRALRVADLIIGFVFGYFACRLLLA
jgi:threonine/homoserine/homoserine lactone efflux protein